MSAETPNFQLPDWIDLDLPDAPDFISEPPRYTLNEMIVLCEALLPYWNTQRFVVNQPEPDRVGEIFRL